MSTRRSSSSSSSRGGSVVIQVSIPVVTKKGKAVVAEESTSSSSGGEKRGKRSAAAVIEVNESPAAKRKKDKKKDTISLAQNMIDGGWNHLYDRNISKNVDQLRELVVDVFVLFCGNITNRAVIQRAVDFIEPLYNKNSYHCFEHAVHVLCNCSYFLTQVHEIFDEVEKLAILFAALIHDVEHMGVTNMALINKRHEFAKKYHNQSVAEMNSLSIGLGLLERNGYDLIANLSPENRRKFSDFVIDLVLTTDIADMYKKQLLYLKLRDQHDEETGRLRVDTNAGKLALLMLILRSSDVGSSMQSLTTAHSWVRNYYLEVKLASMRGDGPFFDDDVFFTQQIKYIEGHSMKLVDHLSNTGRIDREFIDTLRENCNNNQRDWISQGREMLVSWSEEEVLKNHSAVIDETDDV